MALRCPAAPRVQVWLWASVLRLLAQYAQQRDQAFPGTAWGAANLFLTLSDFPAVLVASR